jgi:hypothetical protein
LWDPIAGIDLYAELLNEAVATVDSSDRVAAPSEARKALLALLQLGDRLLDTGGL